MWLAEIRNRKRSFKHKYGMIFILILLLISFGLLSRSFFTPNNLGNILITEVTTGCLALGAMFILIIDEFDLSLGYILCFCMILGAYFAEKGWGTFGILLIMLAAGILCGFINGLIVTRLKISSFIATLSVGLTLSGISQALSRGGILNNNIPKSIMNFSQGKIGALGYSVIFLVLLCIILHYIFNYTIMGRNMYAIGNSSKSAAIAGIKVSRIKVLAFLLAGLFCGTAAVMLLGQLGAASSAYGTSILLPAYAMVFLSKAAFTPGRINVPGVMLAVLLLGIGSNGVQIIGISVWGSHVFEGLILIFSIGVSNVLSRPVRNQ